MDGSNTGRQVENFILPSIEPASPPLTPSSSQTSPSLRRRPIFEHLRSPPPHIRPSDIPHQFSYTPPRLERDDEASSSEDDDDDWLALRAKIFRSARRSKISQDSSHPKSNQSHMSRVAEILSEAESEARSVARDRRDQDTIHILVTEEIDFTLEELRDDDLAFFGGIEVLRPYLIEDALSDRALDDMPEATGHLDLPEELQQFRCELSNGESHFEKMQRLRRLGRRKRWSRGGSHKRSHTESVGSGSDDNEDIELFDTSSVGSTNRRLRRCTRGKEDMIRPRTSLLFDEIPKELEELKWLEENMPPDLAEDVADFSDHWAKIWMDEIRYEISEFDDDDEHEEKDMTFPQWLSRMEVESNPSRPTTARGGQRTRP